MKAFLAKAMEGISHSFSHGDKYYEHIPSNGLSLAYDIIYYVCSTITHILGNCGHQASFFRPSVQMERKSGLGTRLKESLNHGAVVPKFMFMALEGQ